MTLSPADRATLEHWAHRVKTASVSASVTLLNVLARAELSRMDAAPATEPLRHREDCASQYGTWSGEGYESDVEFRPCDCGAGGPVPSNHPAEQIDGTDIAVWDGEERREDVRRKATLPVAIKPVRTQYLKGRRSGDTWATQFPEFPAEPIKEPQGSEEKNYVAASADIAGGHSAGSVHSDKSVEIPLAPPTGTLPAEMIEALVEKAYDDFDGYEVLHEALPGGGKGKCTLKKVQRSQFKSAVLAMLAAAPKAEQPVVTADVTGAPKAEPFVVTAKMLDRIRGEWLTQYGDYDTFIACRLTERAAEHAREQVDEDLLTCLKIWKQSAADGKTRIAELAAELAKTKMDRDFYARQHEEHREFGSKTYEALTAAKAELTALKATAADVTDEDVRIACDAYVGRVRMDRVDFGAWAPAIKAALTADRQLRLMRQPAGGEPSEAEVEAAARSAYNCAADSAAINDTWDNAPKSVKALWRSIAHAVIRAAYAVRQPAAIRQVTAEELYLAFWPSLGGFTSIPSADREHWQTRADALNALLAEPAVLATQGEPS